MATARGPAFTTAVRMVDRVLGDTAGQRAMAEPARPAGLGVIGVRIVGVRYGTNRRHAIRPRVALLTRVEAQDGPTAVAADILSVSTG